MEKHLLEHAARYPLAQTQDFVKLAYQQEFGPGHMVADSAGAMARLAEEWHTMPPAPPPPAALEAIGGGLWRAHLRCFSQAQLGALCGFFVSCANQKRGSAGGLAQRLEAILRLCRGGRLGPDYAQAAAWIEEYSGRGFEPVGHSREYCRAYLPAYRVVGDDCRAWFEKL